MTAKMKLMNGIYFLMTLLLFSFIPWSAIHAQDELDFKPRTDVSDGLGVMSADSNALINFRFRMQNRAMVFSESLENLQVNEVEARVRRLRLRMDGFLLSPKFSYYIQLSFSRADQDWEASQVPNVVRDAVVFYFFQPNLYLSFGQTKLPGNRQRVVSSGMLQFVDRSIVNARFNIDRDFGLRAFYQNNLGSSFFRSHLAISSGEGRNAVNSDNGLAYTLRQEWLPFGQFNSDGDYFEGDLLREPKPRLAIGGTAIYNEKAVRTGGQIGEFLTNPVDIRTVLADAIFKWNGFSTTFEYAFRDVSAISNTRLFDNSTIHVFEGQGWTVQSSYLFKNNWELAARMSRIQPSTPMREFADGNLESALGFTKYFNGHRIKLQGNLYYFNNSASWNVRNDRFAVAFQLEVGI
jgi:phosphate-selective porin OprO/OprP